MPKQEVLTMSFVVEHGLTLDSLTSDLTAAEALVREQLITVVVAAFDRPSVLELEMAVIAAGGRMEILRRRRPPQGPQPQVSYYRIQQIREAADRGADPTMISTVLNVPLNDVLLSLGREAEFGHAVAEFEPTDDPARRASRPAARR